MVAFNAADEELAAGLCAMINAKASVGKPGPASDYSRHMFRLIVRFLRLEQPDELRKFFQKTGAPILVVADNEDDGGKLFQL